MDSISTDTVSSVDGDIAGETQAPDPRRPGKSRWSVQPIPPFSKKSMADPLLTGGNPGASSPNGSLPVSPAKSDSESLTVANGLSSGRSSVG